MGRRMEMKKRIVDKDFWFAMGVLVVLLGLVFYGVAFCNECVGPFQDPTCSYLKCMEGLCK